MKYSIIVPVYNVEKYLRECIESVIAQTYSDWELILVDDGSTDDSPSICDEYAEKDSRIKAIHVKNGGAYKARVLAKDYIEGEYTIGLDSDDMYAPTCLERIEKAISKTDADMIAFGCLELDEKNNISSRVPFGYEAGKIYNKEDFLEKTLLLKDHALWDKAVKSTIYKSTDYIIEDYRLSLSLDYIQVVPLLCGVNKVFTLDEGLYIYRLRDGSISHNYKFSNMVDNDWLNFQLRDFLQRQSIYSDAICFALERSYMEIFLLRLYSLRWDITIKEKKIINEFDFLNSIKNDLGLLIDNKGKRALVQYMKNGVWGPKSIIYHIFLKFVVKPMKNK